MVTADDIGSGFLPGSGEMAALVRTRDWTPRRWGHCRLAAEPAHDRQPVPGVQFPDQHLWVLRHVQIYNDGYRVVCGEAVRSRWPLRSGRHLTW